jgi:hypothetical protein
VVVGSVISATSSPAAVGGTAVAALCVSVGVLLQADKNKTIEIRINFCMTGFF